jgi:hypothetical protein
MSNYVTISSKVADEALVWVKECCPNYVTNDLHCDGYNTYNPEKYDFFFVPAALDEMTMFALKFA